MEKTSWIRDAHSLQNWVYEFLKAPPLCLGLDTEFLRVRTYWPELCLIQIAYQDQAVLIDPLAFNNIWEELLPLKTLLEDPSILKIIHAGQQDWEIFYKGFNCHPQSVFDTQVAALFAGLGESLGYDTLVYKVLGKGIDKSAQQTAWGQRPLDQTQILYALQDVAFLEPLYETLKQRLRALNRLFWVQEESLLLAQSVRELGSPEKAWERLRLQKKTPNIVQRASILAAWREECAQKNNCPRGYIASDSLLAFLAMRPPKELEAFQQSFEKQKIYDRASLENLFQALGEKKEKAPPLASFQKPLTEQQKSVYDILRLLIKEKAEELNLPSYLLATKDNLKAVVQGKPIEQTLLGQSWRFEMMGSLVKKVLEGEVPFYIKEGKISLKKEDDHASVERNAV